MKKILILILSFAAQVFCAPMGDATPNPTVVSQGVFNQVFNPVTGLWYRMQGDSALGIEVNVKAMPAGGASQKIADGSAAGEADVINTTPSTEYGLVTRNIPSGTQPVSGTVTANIGTSGNLALDASVTGLQVSQGSTTSGQKGELIQGAVTTAAPTYTTGQSSPVSLKTTGSARTEMSEWIGSTAPTVGSKTSANSIPVVVASDQGAVPVSGTLTANIGTSGSLALDASVTGLQVSQGSTTSGQKGGLIQGAVTTAAPTYTTGQSSPVSLKTTGSARTEMSEWIGSTAPTVGSKTSANSIPVVVASDQGAVPASQSGTWTVQPGNTANTTAWLFAGGKTNNNAAPGATNFGALGSLANASAPSWTEGNLVTTSVDLSGRTRIDNSSWIGSTAPTVGSKTSANSIPVVVASDQGAVPVKVTGNAGASIDGAIASTPPANAIQIGIKATTANPTNATAGNAVAIMGDKAGRQVVAIGNVRELIGVQTTTIAASTTETTVITAGGAGVFNDISLLSICMGTTPTATTATLKDATAGTTRAIIDLPGTQGNCTTMPFPATLPQSGANANWTITLGSASPTVHINTVFVKNL